MNLRYREEIDDLETIEPPRREAPSPDISVRLYQLHGFRLIDGDGVEVGLVDWIWADEASGAAEFIGTKLRWLRGSARAIPAFAMKIDLSNRTVTVDHQQNQIHAAPRHRIDRELAPIENRAVARHFRRRSSPQSLTTLKRFAA